MQINDKVLNEKIFTFLMDLLESENKKINKLCWEKKVSIEEHIKKVILLNESKKFIEESLLNF